MSVAPSEAAAYATELARVFGASLAFAPPADERGCQLIRTRLAAALGDVRPQADGPSLGEALRLLTEALRLLTEAQGPPTQAPVVKGPRTDGAGRGQLGKTRATKLLAELQELFVQATFRRTKRAERGRLFAQLVVLFGLEPALGLEAAPGLDAAVERDPEGHLRRVRRALRGF